MTFSSRARIPHGTRLPRSASSDGAGIPPQLEWTGAPPATASLALICEDPDAPFPQPFAHWLVYGLAPDATSVRGAYCEGQNSKLELGFTAAAPPPGHGKHRYHFQIFALDARVTLEPGAGRSALLAAMRGHVMAWGEVVGLYERS